MAKRSSSPAPRSIPSGKNPHAVALGKLGGKKGGEARAKALSPKRRKEIGQKAIEKRWEREGPDANQIAKAILDHIIKTN